MAIHSLVKIGNLTTLTQVIDSCPQQRSRVVNERDCEGLTSVHLSCVIGRLDVLQLLRNKGASLTARDIRGRTPLIWASLKGATEIVKYLLAQPEVDYSVLDFTGDSALHYAATQGRLEIVQLLCQHHQTVRLPQRSVIGVKNLNFGMTPLELAAWAGRLEVVKVLREYGAEVNVVNNRGLSPLHFAAQAGNLKLVEYLVSEGASVHVKSKERKTPLESTMNEEVRQMMLKTKRVVPSLERICIRTIRARMISKDELEILPAHLQRKLLDSVIISPT